MKTSKYFLVLFAFSFAMGGCIKDTTFPVEKPKAKLVIHGITATDQPFEVFVSKSAGILDYIDDRQSLAVPDASVQLYADGVLVDSFEYVGPYQSFMAKAGTTARPGIRYQLRASAPGLSPVESEAFLKNDFPVFVSSTVDRGAKKIDGEWMDELRIRFNDPVQTANFYLFNILTPFYYDGMVTYFSNSTCLYTNDPDVDDGGLDALYSTCLSNDIYLSDRNFNGKQKELVLFAPTYRLQVVTDTVTGRIYRPIVQLYNITEEYYKYKKSINQYHTAMDNPFAEPVSIFTNVRNGFGAFAVSHLQVDTIRLR